jgi:hypothetical protein
VPQLFSVPRVAVPVGEYLVTISELLRAGPEIWQRVSAVTRRLKADVLFTAHWPVAEKAPPVCFHTSTIDTPCIATSRSTSSAGRTPAVMLVGAAACRNCWFTYSWFIPSRPRLLPMPGAAGAWPASVSPKYSTPSWLSPERWL